VNVSADVNDSDGTVSSVEADVWENGTKIVSDASLSDSNGDGTWNIDELFNVSEKEVYYNISLTATDDDGATTTTEISQFIQDNSPGVVFSEPENITYNDYDVPYSLKINDDGDDIENETVTCELYNNTDSEYFREATRVEGSDDRIEGTIRHKEGSYFFKYSCVDGGEHNDTRYYSVEYDSIEDIFGSNTTHETRTPNFDMDLKNGDMINDVQYFLEWNGSVVQSSDVRDTTGITTNSVFLSHPGVPLVDQNSTKVKWEFIYQVNRTRFDGTGYVLENQSSQEYNQSIFWSYWENQSYYQPRDADYIEREDFKHYLELRNKSDKASIQGTTTYDRDGSTTSMSRSSTSDLTDTWMGSIDVADADSFNQSSFNASSEVTLSFRDSSRVIDSGKDELDVHKIRLTTCNQGLDSSEALVFDTNHETGGYDVKSDLVIDSTLWKTGEVNRTYNFQSDNKEEHKFCIYPKWASYNITTTDQLIQFQGTDDDLAVRSHFLGYNGADTISNSSTTVPLRLLNKTETSRIGFEISDPDGNAYPGVICRIDRYFPGEGAEQTVAMIKTGSQGETETFLERNEIYYSFYCYKNGEKLDTFDRQTLSNPMRLQIGAEKQDDFLDYDGDLGTECSSNETQVSCEYESSSADLEKAVLKVKDIGDVYSSTVCDKEGVTTTGTLTCSGLNTSQNSYRATLTGYYPGDVEVQPFNSFLGSPDGWAGSVGLIATAMLFLISFLAGGFHPVAGVGLGTLSLVMSKMIGIFPVSQDILMSIVAVGVVTGWVMTK
jgi:hypothetical protein